MFQCNITRTKLKICLLTLTILFLLILFLVGDKFISRIRSPTVRSCVLCPFKNNATLNKAEFLHFTILSDDSHDKPINVMLSFVHANRNIKLKHNFDQCISSLLKHSSVHLHLHVLTDDSSVNDAINMLEIAAPLAKTATQVSLYDVNIFVKPLQDLIHKIRPYFSFKQGAYYSDELFYVSIALYKIIDLEQLIMLDVDIKVLNDIKYLFDEFKKFSNEALIGMAREQQPVYRHVLSEYRKLHNDSRVGDPLPNGSPGFNSGVMLLHLQKIRNSSLYKSIVDNSTCIQNLVEKYKFKGHLGDQDFYTLISLDYPEFFHELPCTWNKQLCQWWRHHGYSKVFDLYHNCSGKINLLHGNCNSLIPES